MGNDFKFSKGDIETIILNALYNSDKYGYEIAKEIKEKTDNKYEIKQPTLYGYLKRLEDQNLIAFYWGEESHGGRRKYFRLTSYGKSICDNETEKDFEKSNSDFSDTDFSSDTLKQDNDFSVKKSRKRKIRKDFKDENENQELFAKLMQLSQTAEDINTDDYPISIDDFEENYAKTETSNDSTEILFNDETFEQAQISFVDEQINEEQFDFVNESDFSLEKDSYSTDLINETETLCEPKNISQEVEEEFKIDTSPVLERKKNQISQTEIYNEFTFVEIESTQKEELPRIENCDEKFVPKTENIHVDPEVEEIKQQKAEYLNNLLSTPSYEEAKSSSQPVQEENETESQYKQILTNLLGDQIINTDDKIAQITPKISSYRNEFTSENLTMAEMADSLAKEGYRIRFYNSTTSQYRAVPMLAKNKINCVTAWSTLIVFYALLGISWLICGSGVNVFTVCITAFAFLLIPSYYTYVYITRPDVRIKSEHNFKHSIGSKTLIFIFATAFLFTLNLLLFKTNLADPADMMHKFIIPELLIFSLIISEIIYNAFLKHKSFYN
ncbi:MAG: PadR family transcriptional regulator [Clostridiales bacterium]|nr:PadR family transcriptional regulator [Clostridiales bacterium]